MANVNYDQVMADIVTQMLPIVYKEMPKVGNMVGSRERNAVMQTMEIARYAIQELKGAQE